MKIKIKVTILLPLFLSSCATIVTEHKESKVYAFDYNTKCIDKKNKKVHFFETNSYYPLDITSLLKNVTSQGFNNGLDLTNMNCFKISPEFINLW